jgi:hypothetical protein
MLEYLRKVFLKKTSEKTTCPWLHCFLLDLEHVENMEKKMVPVILAVSILTSVGVTLLPIDPLRKSARVNSIVVQCTVHTRTFFIIHIADFRKGSIGRF